MGSIAVFSEKYGEVVRVVDVSLSLKSQRVLTQVVFPRCDDANPIRITFSRLF